MQEVHWQYARKNNFIKHDFGLSCPARAHPSLCSEGIFPKREDSEAFSRRENIPRKLSTVYSAFFSLKESVRRPWELISRSLISTAPANQAHDRRQRTVLSATLLRGQCWRCTAAAAFAGEGIQVIGSCCSQPREHVEEKNTLIAQLRARVITQALFCFESSSKRRPT